MGIGWSIHKNDGWVGQFNRVKRWHSRLIEASKGRHSKWDLEDFAFTFFQNCYHLRDWIGKTSSCPQKEIEKLMKDSNSLRLCRDIANGTKHESIDKDKASVDRYFSIGYEYAKLEPFGAKLFIIADDKYDLITFANECLNAWIDFLNRFPEYFPEGTEG